MIAINESLEVFLTDITFSPRGSKQSMTKRKVYNSSWNAESFLEPNREILPVNLLQIRRLSVAFC